MTSEQKGVGVLAFPQGSTNYGGLTLRDYMAAKALNGLVSETYVVGEPSTAWQVNGYPCDKVLEVADYYAEAAYKLADAMLRARSSQP